MKKIRSISSLLLLCLLIFTVIGCNNNGGSDKTFKEPKVIETSLSELRELNDEVNLKNSYLVKALVVGFGTSLNSREEPNEKGNLIISDLDGSNETILMGSTATSSSLSWDKKNGVYTFTNPCDFLENDKTKKIKSGDEITILVVRDNNNGIYLQGVIKNVVPKQVTIVYPEPTIDILSLEEILSNTRWETLKKAYKTSVIVTGYGSGETSDIAPKSVGALKVSSLDSSVNITIASSTSTRNSLKWNEKTGNYEYNFVNDFLSNSLTKDIKIGDQLEIIMVKSVINNSDIYYGIITGVNFVEEDLLTFANYTDKNLKLMIKQNNSRTRVATLQTDITDLSKVDVKFSLSNSYGAEVEVVAKVDSSNHYYFGCFITPTQNIEGVFLLTCTITNKETGVKLIDVENLEVEIYTSYVGIMIDTSLMPIRVIGSAFDDVVTLGYYYFDGVVSLKQLKSFNKDNKITLPLITKLSNGSETVYYDKLNFTSSDDEIISIDEKGSFYLVGKSGVVKLTVSDTTNSSVCAILRLNVVNNGINISNDTELLEVTNNVINKEYVIVLKDNIMLASKIETTNDNFNYELYAKSMVTTINPTTDTTYYKNTNQVDKAQIKYAVEISTDIYGNGYAISGDNLTQKLYKKYGYRLYRGPLDLVRYNKEYSGSDNNLAVKSQDDCIFIVLRDNINIMNVELKGCNDDSLINSAGNYDLTMLDYCGTVLEIVGNNCSIEYSRINNGRTGVRIYGKSHTDNDFNASDYRIKTSISNTLFANAREFLLKLGTNQTIKNESVVNQNITNPQDSDYQHASPYLNKENGYYQIDNNNYRDEYFYNNYILTDVSVENSVFMNAGLFSVGLDTMFGGLVLHGWDFSDSFKFGSELGWGGISGTSYPALLRLKGDVRFYDWKKVSAVNSDTLIEGLRNSDGSLSSIASKIGFNLDFSSLLFEYYQTHDSILSSYEGSPYVNGAIAYFGGGKNYSCVAMDEVSSSFTKLVPYSISVDYFAPSNPRFIYYTAGLADFRFLLYDATSSLTITRQYNDLSDNSAYDILKKK